MIITPNNFDADKIRVVKTLKVDSYGWQRYKIKYDTGNGAKLAIFIPNITKHSIMSSGGIVTNKYNEKRLNMCIKMDPFIRDQNDYAEMLHEVSIIVCRAMRIKEKSVVTKYQNETTNKDMYCIWTELITSNAGKVFTDIYDVEKNDVKIDMLKSYCMVRPAITLSVNKKNNEASLKSQLLRYVSSKV